MDLSGLLSASVYQRSLVSTYVTLNRDLSRDRNCASRNAKIFTSSSDFIGVVKMFYDRYRSFVFHV